MKTRHKHSIGISGMAYWLPPTAKTVRDLDAEGKLSSAPDVLEGFGFERVRVCDEETHFEMAHRAVEELMVEEGTSAEDVGLILYAGALTSSGTMANGSATEGPALQLNEVMDFFEYPVSRIQHAFGFTNAAVAGIGQQGCAAFLSALRTARNALLAEPDLQSVLCVSADVLPRFAKREISYTLISDGACAALVTRAGRYRILACSQITKGAFWKTGELQNEIIAAYFPTARNCILDTVAKAGLELKEIDWIVPHNISLRSWELLLGVLGLSKDRLFDGNIPRIGHTLCADHVINLKDLTDSGAVREGDHLLLFTFGFGLNWSCTILRCGEQR